MSSPKMFRKEEVDGKIVVEASGKALGKAKDIAFALDGSVVVIVQGDDNSEIQVSTDRIAGIDDYIIVRKEAKGEPAAMNLASQPANPVLAPAPAPASAGSATPVLASVTSGLCRSCGAPLRAGAKFCTKCGTPV